MSGRGRIALAVWLGAFAIIGSGCAQPRLERLARQVARSVPRESGAITSGQITLTLGEVRVSRGGIAVPAMYTSGALASARFLVQPGRARGAIVGGGEAGIVALTDSRVLYARRLTRSAADKRPWVRLELDRLDDIAKPRVEALLQQQNAGNLAVVSPLLVTDLLAGILTGSIKQRAVDTEGNRHFTFNVSVDKANREQDLSDDQRDDRKRLLRALAITGDIFTAKATLRADGSLARLAIVLPERPDKQSRIDLLAELVTDPPQSGSTGLTPPTRVATIRVGSLAELRGSIADQLAPARPAGIPVPRQPA